MERLLILEDDLALGEGVRLALQGDWHGIEFRLVSADYVNFKPVKILD